MSVISRSDGAGREHVGPAGEVLLDDVVLGRAGQRAHRGRLAVPGARRLGGLLLGGDLVEREQPHRGRVDRHRGVHLGERDAVEERPHVADVADRHADLADLAAGQRVVRVVAGLGGQVEGDRQAGLALGEVAPVERVGWPRRWSGRRTCASPTAGRAPGARRGSCSPSTHGSTVAAGGRGGAGPQAVRGATAGRRDRPRQRGCGRARGAGGRRAAAGRCGVTSDEDEAAPGAAGPAVGVDEDAEPGRVADLGVAEVQQQVARRRRSITAWSSSADVRRPCGRRDALDR